MTLALIQTSTALRPGLQTSFVGTGGTSPYTYAVQPGGAGGTIDAATGTYTAPATMTPGKPFDTVQVTDALSATATATVLVGTPLHLVGDVIQTVLALAAGRVYLWDQKIIEPSDAGLFVALSMPMAKPIGVSTRFNSTTGDTEQFAAMVATVDIDVISRSTAARDQKEQVLMALSSPYAQRQMAANSFYVSALGRFQNLSEVDGAAIPYRYRLSVQMQYAVPQVQPATYFDTFQTPGVVTDDGSGGAGSQSAGTPIPAAGGTQPGSDTIIDGGGP